MSDIEVKNKIIDCIGKEKSIYMICKKVIILLKQEQVTSDIVEFLFKEMYLYLNSKVSHMEDGEWKLLEEQTKKYGNAWGEIIGTLLNERLDKEEFYMRLWNSIIATPLFEKEEAKICVLYMACMNMCIPYYKLQSEGQIGEERYREYVEELRDDIINVRSLIFQPCRFYTDRALALLDQLERCGEKEKQAVLLSQMIKMFEWKGRFRVKNEED